MYTVVPHISLFAVGGREGKGVIRWREKGTRRRPKCCMRCFVRVNEGDIMSVAIYYYYCYLLLGGMMMLSLPKKC